MENLLARDGSWFLIRDAGVQGGGSCGEKGLTFYQHSVYDVEWCQKLFGVTVCTGIVPCVTLDEANRLKERWEMD